MNYRRKYFKEGKLAEYKLPIYILSWPEMRPQFTSLNGCGCWREPNTATMASSGKPLSHEEKVAMKDFRLAPTQGLKFWNIIIKQRRLSFGTITSQKQTLSMYPPKQTSITEAIVTWMLLTTHLMQGSALITLLGQ